MRNLNQKIIESGLKKYRPSSTRLTTNCDRETSPNIMIMK